MKYALVTGGSRGIGKAISIKLARDGYNILLNFKSNTEEAGHTKTLIEETGMTCDLLPFDVADSDAVTNAITSWKEQHKEDSIDIVINNAGIRNDNLLIYLTDDNWKNVTQASLDGFFYVTRAVLQPMILKRWGRIINIVSLSGLKGMPGQTNYSAAKAGLIGATKALAQEVAKKGITVNAVAPGFISTDMTKDLDENELSKLVPMKRFGQPDEVAELVSFLASDKASYITGEVISINGGLY